MKQIQKDGGNAPDPEGPKRRKNAPFKETLSVFRVHDLSRTDSGPFDDKPQIAQYILDYAEPDHMQAREDRGQGVLYLIKTVEVGHEKDSSFEDLITHYRRDMRNAMVQMYSRSRANRLSVRDNYIYSKHVQQQ